jgi:hypothetical protein
VGFGRGRIARATTHCIGQADEAYAGGRISWLVSGSAHLETHIMIPYPPPIRSLELRRSTRIILSFIIFLKLQK